MCHDRYNAVKTKCRFDIFFLGFTFRFDQTDNKDMLGQVRTLYTISK